MRYHYNNHSQDDEERPMQQDISYLELAKLQGPLSTKLRSHNQNYEKNSFNKKSLKMFQPAPFPPTQKKRSFYKKVFKPFGYAGN